MLSGFGPGYRVVALAEARGERVRAPSGRPATPDSSTAGRTVTGPDDARSACGSRGIKGPGPASELLLAHSGPSELENVVTRTQLHAAAVLRAAAGADSHSDALYQADRTGLHAMWRGDRSLLTRPPMGV
eukprot:COSAG02_NODE_5173_length_4572_cov_2.069528_4_plen_130_part_00